jgi:hypothetical protein
MLATLQKNVDEKMLVTLPKNFDEKKYRQTSKNVGQEKMFATILKMLTNNVGSTPKNVDEKIFATF